MPTLDGSAAVRSAPTVLPRSVSDWTVIPEEKKATTTYLGGELSVFRRDNGALGARFVRPYSEAEGARKDGAIEMSINLGDVTNVQEAQDRAEHLVRENLAAAYSDLWARLMSEVAETRKAEAGPDPF
jgi:hypothetical protein